MNPSLTNSRQTSLLKLSSYLSKIATKDQIRKVAPKYINPFEIYQNNFIGFGEQILGQSFTDDIKDLMLSVRDHQITIAKSSNAVGKTHCAAVIAIAFFFAYQDSQIFTCAYPEPKLRQLLWGELGKLIAYNQELFKHISVTDLNIARNKSSFITGVTVPLTGTVAQREARFSGRHAPHLMFILDEGDTIPDEVYRGIESCMSGGHFRLLVLFNPREEQGPVYRMERDGRANIVELKAFNHPNVITGENKIPGAVDRNTTARRINLWARPLNENEIKSSECFELPQFLEGFQARDQRGILLPPLKAGIYRITSPELSYMVLAQYPGQSAYSLISREWINRARARWDLWVSQHGELPPQGVRPIMGLDVAEFGADNNCECNRYGNWVPPLKTWGDVDTIVTGETAYADYKGNNCCWANIDGTGVGAGVAPHMSKLGYEDYEKRDIDKPFEDVIAVSVKVASAPTMMLDDEIEFCSMRDQLWWLCAEWLRRDQAMLPPDEELIEELLVAKRETVRGKIKIMDKKTMRELLKRSPDRADSLCLTFAPDQSDTGFVGFV